ncbi:MAG: hypothetical protein ACR2N9_08765 [Acidimicrobiia bacterium]
MSAAKVNVSLTVESSSSGGGCHGLNKAYPTTYSGSDTVVCNGIGWEGGGTTAVRTFRRISAGKLRELHRNSSLEEAYDDGRTSEKVE